MRPDVPIATVFPREDALKLVMAALTPDAAQRIEDIANATLFLKKKHPTLFRPEALADLT